MEWKKTGWLGGKNNFIVLFIHGTLKRQRGEFVGGIGITWAAFKKYTSYLDPLKLLIQSLSLTEETEYQRLWHFLRPSS